MAVPPVARRSGPTPAASAAAAAKQTKGALQPGLASMFTAEQLQQFAAAEEAAAAASASSAAPAAAAAAGQHCCSCPFPSAPLFSWPTPTVWCFFFFFFNYLLAIYHPQSKVTSRDKTQSSSRCMADAQCRQVRKAVRNVRHRNRRRAVKGDLARGAAWANGARRECNAHGNDEEDEGKQEG